MFPLPFHPKRDSIFKSPHMAQGNMEGNIKGFITTTINSITTRENLGVGREAEAAGITEAPEAVALANPKTKVKSNIPEKAARLPFFSQAWQQVTSNSLILNIVLNGYKIQFIKVPVQTEFKPRSMSNKNSLICQDKVKEFLKYKIIKVVTPNHDQFISHIFPVPKKAIGEYRIIFDLSELNTYVRKIHFKMDRIPDIMSLIKPVPKCIKPLRSQ